MDEANTERWLPVLGYEGFYEASDQGRIRSLSRWVYAGPRAGRRLHAGRVLRQPATPDGRPVVNLGVDGNHSARHVAHLVAEAFLGPRPEGQQVCHNNGDSADNRLSNLRWDTPSANILDSVQHGTHNNARKTHCPQGHEYSGSNLLLCNGGRTRRCVTCVRRVAREAARRRREARATN